MAAKVSISWLDGEEDLSWVESFLEGLKVGEGGEEWEELEEDKSSMDTV